MSQPALDKFLKSMNKDGLLIVDGTMVPNIPEEVKTLLSVNGTEIAENILGGKLFANIFMLGVAVAKSAMVSPDSVRKALETIMPPKHLARNIAAFDAGLNYRA
jgi:Pyruvate/2-oxoacid:ferredoxin oxidoreductase gamma subunit